MAITNKQLKQIINEEVNSVMSEEMDFDARVNKVAQLRRLIIDYVESNGGYIHPEGKKYLDNPILKIVDMIEWK